MKFWLLNNKSEYIELDAYRSFVVRAESEQRARAIIRQKVSSGWRPDLMWPIDETDVSCFEVRLDEPEGIVLEHAIGF